MYATITKVLKALALIQGSVELEREFCETSVNIPKDVVLLSVVLLDLLSSQQEKVWAFSITDLRLRQLPKDFFSSVELHFQD